MSYYGRPMGDYRTYGYAGDPGFLSSLFRGIKKVVRYAAPFIPGVGGLIAGAVGGAASQPGLPRITPTFPTVGGTQFVGQVTMPGGASFSGGVMTPGQGRLPPYSAAGPGVLPAGGRGGAMIPSGYHFAKDGSGKLVRNRRMNVANPRALRRSMRRVQGFEKLARRTITFTRRVKMKKRKSS